MSNFFGKASTIKSDDAFIQRKYHIPAFKEMKQLKVAIFTILVSFQGPKSNPLQFYIFFTTSNSDHSNCAKGNKLYIKMWQIACSLRLKKSLQQSFQ